MSIEIIGAFVLVFLGILGSILPLMPGPLFSFLAILILFFAKAGAVPPFSLALFGIGMLTLFVLDYVAPILGAKFAGSSARGIWGAILGGLLGLFFFPPLGIFLGAFLGAFLLEMASGKDTRAAFRSGVGTLVASAMVLVLQIAYALLVMIYFFFKIWS